MIDGFEETDAWSRFDGAPTVMIQVFRIGDENAPDVSAAVHEYVDGKQDRLPPGISIATWQDTSVLLSDRTNLLLKNGFQGLVLVFIILTLFLRMRLALWVAVGIPIAFLGSIAVMPHVDLTINMMTLFSFILVLGIVVDDAHRRRRAGTRQAGRVGRRSQGRHRWNPGGGRSRDLRRADDHGRVCSLHVRSRHDGQLHAGHTSDRHFPSCSFPLSNRNLSCRAISRIARRKP